MEAYNITQDIILARDVETAFSFLKRVRGLLGKSSFPRGAGLLLKPCNSVHSCFMKFPFDALFLDQEMKIVYIIESMHPFRFSPVIQEAQSVLELPAGTVQLSGSKVGDKISLYVDKMKIGIERRIQILESSIYNSVKIVGSRRQ